MQCVRRLVQRGGLAGDEVVLVAVVFGVACGVAQRDFGGVFPVVIDQSMVGERKIQVENFARGS